MLLSGKSGESKKKKKMLLTVVNKNKKKIFGGREGGKEVFSVMPKNPIFVIII